MMMAIINLAFEDVKKKSAEFQTKYQPTAYLKRTAKEMVGIKLAKKIRPIYRKPNEKVEFEEPPLEISEDFSDKTNKLLEYVEKTYLGKNLDPNVAQFMSKMSEKKQASNGFDIIFKEDRKKSS